MTSVTSTGLGSGLDINSIVTAIVDAEKDPALKKMLKASAEATAKISAYGTLNSALSDFQDSFQKLTYNSTFSAATASSSDSSVVEATLGIGAATGSWSFEVKQLAQAQTIVSSSDNSYPEATAAIGTGVISFSYGTFEDDGTFSINPNKAIETLTIDASNNSLDQLRDAINEGDYSVSASIIDDGVNYRLVLANKETGAENSLQLTVVDDDGDHLNASGLSSLTYSADVKHMDQTSVAQDASIIMNGVDINRPSNDIANVIEGVTLNLGGVTKTGENVSLTITKDISGVEEQINAFVENYNGTIKQMNALTSFGGESGTNGALNGESAVRNIENQMRSLLNASMTHLDGPIKSFADLGLITKRDGTLEVDTTRFNNALNNSMDSVADFFTSSGGASDSFVEFTGNSSLTVAGTYDLSVTKLATQGQLTGTLYSVPITINDSNATFSMRLDGHQSGDIILASGTYQTIEEFSTELQSKINSDTNFVKNDLNVSILADMGKLSIVSNNYGSVSTVAITAIADDVFGFSVGGGVNGENVAGLIDGIVASGHGQGLLAKNGDSIGLRILVKDGDLGARGTVTYSDGMSSMLDAMLDGIIDNNISSSDGDVNNSTTTIDTTTDSLHKKINQLDEQEEILLYRMDKLETRLYKQFNSMDRAVSNMDNLKSYLKSTLDALPGYTRD
ncbi:MAG: flagellar filament capping protein FliD [Psychromonas sp.]